MFFSKLSVFAAVAFGAFTSALPLSTPAGDLPLPNLPVDPSSVVGTATGVVGSVAGNLPVGSVAGNLPVAGAAGGLVPRVDVKGVAAILVDVQAQLTPVTDLLLFVDSHNVTVDAISAPVGHIVDILGAATVSLKALVGADASVILLTVDGTAKITVAELAPIVAGVICTVFKALGAVVIVAGATIDAAVFQLLVTAGGAVAGVLAIALHLVAGVAVSVSTDLIAAVVPLVSEVVAIVLHLNIVSITALLHISA